MAFKETYNIDASQAERALKALTEDQAKLAKITEESTKRLSAEDKAARRLAEAADPMKKFNRQLEETAVLVGKGKVSFEDASLHLGKYADRISGVGKAQEATFGQRAVSQLASYAAGFVTISTVASGVRGLLADIEKNAEGAASRIRESLESVGELQQIEGLLSNIDFAREMHRRGAVKDVGEGAKLANSLDQAGFNEEEQEFITYDLVGSKFLSAKDGADVATKFAKVRDLLQIDGLENTINKIVQVGGSSSASNPEVAEAITKYGGLFRTLGYDANEILALMENADKQSPSVDVGATRLAALGAQLGAKGLKKGGIAETINSIRDRERRGENIYKILGSKNAVLAYQMYDEDHEQQAFLKQAGLTASAQERGVLGQQLGGIYKDPQFASALYAERAGRRLDQGREDRTGTLQNLFEAARDNAVDYFEGRGMGGGAWFTGVKAWSYQKVADQRAYLQDAMREEAYREKTFKDQGAFSKEFEQQVMAFLERTANATERSADGPVKPSAE